jgi:GxxExxY protein
MTENEIGTLVLDAAFEVHKNLGPGLLESTYEACLAFELLGRGVVVETQLPLPVIYKEVKLDCGYRIDLRVERKVIVEIKSVEALNDVHMAQVLTYMKLSGIKLGYLVNFNVKLLKNGIKRIVLGQL